MLGVSRDSVAGARLKAVIEAIDTAGIATDTVNKRHEVGENSQGSDEERKEESSS